MQSPNRDLAGMPVKKWLPLCAVGAAAALAGLLLPQLLPTPAATNRPEAAKSSPFAYKAPDWPEPPSHRGMFLRLALGTATVLGLCAGTIFLCKRWLVSPQPDSAANGQLQLVETLNLGNRCWVQLVQVNSHPVLVGGDAAGIKTIVSMPESFASTLQAATEEQTPGVASILAQRFSENLDATDRASGRA